MTVKVTKREHPVWKDWMRIREKDPEILTLHRNTPIIGQWQYIYESKKGKISLIELPNYFLDGITLWETCCLEGNLFEDCERFENMVEAEKRIYKILDETKNQ